MKISLKKIFLIIYIISIPINSLFANDLLDLELKKNFKNSDFSEEILEDQPVLNQDKSIDEESVTLNEDLKESDNLQRKSSKESSFANKNFKEIAKLQAINKITTDITNLEIPVNSSLKFGDLIIRVNACWESPSTFKPENKILLRISEESSKKDIFYGWMLSSSPSLSALSHPVYDITAISCQNKS